MLQHDTLAGAAQREPEVARIISRHRESVGQQTTLVGMLEQVVNRVCGHYPEKPRDGVAAARPDNLCGVLEGIADLHDEQNGRLGELIERLSSQV